MALPKGDFSRLLRELRSAGPLDRVRLLGRSLSALRRLSPWDRKVLLRMAGFEGAETLVERLAGNDRDTAEALQRVLAELEEHPDRLEATVRKLGDPKQRTEAVEELLATLDRAVAEPEDEAEEEAHEPEAAPEDEPPEPEPAARESETEPAAAPAPQTIPEPPPVGPGPWKDPMEASAGPAGETPLPEVVPPPPPAPGAPPAPGPAPPVIAEPQRPPAVEPPPAEEAPPAEAPAETEAKPSPVPVPAVASAPARSARDLAAERPTALPRQPVPTLEPALPGEAPSAVGALESLLDLRRRLDAGETVDAAELHRLMDRELPFPWARRRAIQSWIGAGARIDLGEALDLIDTLPPGADRAWCLANLATARPWGAAAWRRIVDAAPSPATRRQLELRRRRS